MSAPATITRPSYRPFRATVTAVTSLSPSFMRVSFTGPDFADFAPHAHDQRIKIVFPDGPECYDDLGIDDEAVRLAGGWYDRWRALPNERRCPFRTYTVRTIDPASRHLDVDIVTHTVNGEPVGPGARWLHEAKPGDEVIIVGPDALSPDSHQGIDWKPGRANDFLLLGDETAAPAIAGIVERLPERCRATALIEVPVTGDAIKLETHPGVSVHYLPRNGAEIGTHLAPALDEWIAGHTDLIQSAATAAKQVLEDVDVDTEILWDSPEAQQSDGFYAWIAGESAVVKRLRRMLVTEHGVNRRRVAFMGYWRAGQAERIG